MISYRKNARGFANRQAPLSGETFGDALRRSFPGDVIVEQVYEDHEYCRSRRDLDHRANCPYCDLVFLVKREDLRTHEVRLVGAFRWFGLGGTITRKLESRA